MTVRIDNEDIPYRVGGVTFLRVRDGAIEATSGTSEKREWLEHEGPLWAAWTGQYRTDIFVVDKTSAEAALSLRTRT